MCVLRVIKRKEVPGMLRCMKASWDNEKDSLLCGLVPLSEGGLAYLSRPGELTLVVHSQNPYQAEAPCCAIEGLAVIGKEENLRSRC